jgi:hypothetical protein
MIERVHRGLGDRARDIIDSEVQSYLNSVWQFQIPDIVPGFYREETFQLPLVVSQTVYNVDNTAAFGGRCRQVLNGMYYSDGEFLDYYTDQFTFYRKWALDSVGTGRPDAVLNYARELRFEKAPDQVYTLYIPATAYQAALTSVGLSNENYAMVVVRGAIRDLAGDLGYDEIFQRFAVLFDQSVRRMTTHTLSRLPGMIPRTRDF